jgi:hypothetical protein
MSAVEHVEVVCPSCESAIWVPSWWLSDWVECPACGVGFDAEPGPLPDLPPSWDGSALFRVVACDRPARRLGRTAWLALVLIAAALLGLAGAVWCWLF